MLFNVEDEYFIERDELNSMPLTLAFITLKHVILSIFFFLNKCGKMFLSDQTD